jgi:hypothetical protein
MHNTTPIHTDLQCHHDNHSNQKGFHHSITRVVIFDMRPPMLVTEQLDEIDATLDATDHLLEWLIEDRNRLDDDRLIDRLGELRREHRNAMHLLELRLENIIDPLVDNGQLNDSQRWVSLTSIVSPIQCNQQREYCSCECDDDQQYIDDQTTTKWVPHKTRPKPFQMTIRLVIMVLIR